MGSFRTGARLDLKEHEKAKNWRVTGPGAVARSITIFPHDTYDEIGFVPKISTDRARQIVAPVKSWRAC
jgi:hypothetical protein